MTADDPDRLFLSQLTILHVEDDRTIREQMGHFLGRRAGRLLLAGPFPAVDAEDPGPAGFSGSLIVAEFDDVDAAQAWADTDPYRTAGVYRAVEVRPFRKVAP